MRLGDIINKIDEIKKNVAENIVDSPDRRMVELKLKETELWLDWCMPTELVNEGKQ